MSLTLTRPFTISTYDPPSTPIALAAQKDPALGRVLGAATDRTTPPQEDTQATRSLDRTPSAKAKVLPWVQGIESEDFEPAEGMFGPYDSQPPTRPHTTFDSAATHQAHAEHQHRQQSQQARSAHPFAYTRTSGPALPLGAIELGAALPVNGHVVPSGRPESDVLSRGAGMRYLNRDVDLNALGIITEIEEEPVRDSGGSVGMGTFGREASKELPAQPAETPKYKSPRKPIPYDVTHKPSKSAKSAAESSKAASPPHEDDVPLPEHHPHVHRPHHDHPFSHAEAERKRAEGLARARQEALAKLQATSIPYGPAPVPSKPVDSGRRETYETTDSGPSFGHILHRDGMPISQHQSMSGMFRLPFGLPIGPGGRPMMGMRGSMGAIPGLGLLHGPPGGFSGLRESTTPLRDVKTHPDKRQTSRSAYVESVEDEQEPVVPGTKTVRTSRSLQSAEPLPARAESNIQPTQDSAIQPADQGKTRTAEASDVAPGRKAAARTRGSAFVKSVAPVNAAAAPAGHFSPQSDHSSSNVQAEPRAESVTALSEARTVPRSHVSTTASNVKRLASDSKFHDETLCQLLEAARLNLIGGEAKRALNRAARARVIELRDMRKHADQQESNDAPVSAKKKNRSTSAKIAKSKHSPDTAKTIQAEPFTPPPAASATSLGPPPWAQDIIARLEKFDLRFHELEKHHQEGRIVEDLSAPIHGPLHVFLNDFMADHMDAEGHGGGVGFRPYGPGALGPDPFAYAPPDSSPEGGRFRSDVPSPQSARVHPVSPTVRPVDESGDVPSWVSDVEMPHTSSGHTPHGPTIHIQAPTESNSRTHRAPAASARSVISRPAQPTMGPVPVDPSEMPPGVRPMTQEMKDRSLPDTPPSDSISAKTRRQSPVPSHASPQAPQHTANVVSRHGVRTRASATTKSVVPPENGNGKTIYETAAGDTPPSDQAHHDKLHIHMKSPPKDEPIKQWDLITQRLFSWAMVWDEQNFVRAMQSISLGEQVEEFPLSIFVMTTFKRYIRYSLSLTPVLHCDKLFVPPNMTDAINKAVHSKNFSAAQEVLEELWYPFGFTEPPRVIIALGRHRTNVEHWTAHRFDCVTHKMTTYSLNHQERYLPDGRPFMWWHAIRLAWPAYNIPDPDSLQQRFVHVQTAEDSRADNSLVAANYARNLFLGYRPERETDLQKMRSMIWEEVKSLLQKKHSGNLVVDGESSKHTFDW